MKTKFFLMLSATAMGIFASSSVALADIIPEDSHYVEKCVKIVNTTEFPDVTFVGYVDSVTGAESYAYEISSNQCLTKGYKFNDFFVYALPKEYAATKELSDIDFLTDSHVLAANLLLDPEGYYIEDTNPLSFEQIEYTISGFANYNLMLYKSRHFQAFNDDTEGTIQVFEKPSVGGLTSDITTFAKDAIQIFTDVPVTHTFYDSIRYVKTRGIVEGYDDGTYKPEDKINRAEFTKILVASKYSTEEIDSCIAKNWSAIAFSDVPQTEWFSKFICVAKMRGIIDGYPDKTFHPGDDVNFVEAAKFLNVYMNVSPATEGDWYVPFVQGLEDLKAIPVSVTAYGSLVTRGEMAEMIFRLRENVTDEASRFPSQGWTAGIKEGE